MKQQLQQYIDASSNCVNLGRTLKAHAPELHEQVLRATSFVDYKKKVKFNERVFCVMNDITEPVIDMFGAPARFINLFKGYSLKEHTAEEYRIRQEREILDAQKPPRKTGRMSKQEAHVRRHMKVNPELYLPTAQVDIDYVECPHTRTRMLSITSAYVTKVLDMTVAEYDALYPGARKSSSRLKQSISRGVQAIDATTGKTKYQKGQEKARQTLSKIDPTTGMTGYKAKGAKTRAGHMANIDEHGRNGFQQQAHQRVTTLCDNGLTVEQNAHIRRLETLRTQEKSNTRASMASRKAFVPLLEFLENNDIRYCFDTNEYAVMSPDKQYYFYDLTVPSLKVAFEYQSNAYHAYPWMNDEEWRTWLPVRGNRRTPEEVHEYDVKKARVLFEERGYVTFHVWENTVENDVTEALCLLKTLYTKS
jgi:hypothetical protein